MCWFRNFFLDPYPEVFVRIQAKIKKRINNQNFTSLGFNRKENTVKCSFKSDTGSSSLFLLIITCLKVLGLDRNFLKIVSGSGTNHSGLISLDFQYRYLIDLHGRRIHELLVMYKYNMKFFSTGCCDIARRVHPYQVRPHCGHGGPLFRYSAQAGPTLWRGSP